MVYIIGSGFSSLAAASYLAQAGYEITILEKNATIGGRARNFKKDGFTFDMGPTWYWMPDVFERFFGDFNLHPSDYYDLQKLSPSYQVYFDRLDSHIISDDLETNLELFEQIESGSSVHLKKFLQDARTNYDIAIRDLVYKPGVSPLELITPETIGLLNKLFGSIKSQIGKKFKNPRLTKILEFPVLFLGAKPSNTPALYNFMNWADFGLGTWHPNGGMSKVVEAMVTLASSLGVRFETNALVNEIVVNKEGAKGLIVNDKFRSADVILSGADYHHTEQLLKPTERQYSEAYWGKKTFAPSALLFYLGFDKKLKNVSHHTLFFDADFDQHAEAIYDSKTWPENPLFYASFPSITDETMAPEGKECATFLIPIAPGLEDSDELRSKYFNLIINRLERVTNQQLKSNILFKKSFCINDFKEDYNAFDGNAYGLANTLTQTAFMRPKIRSGKVKNLFFTGQLTVPGPGVPPALISGKIASELIQKHYPIYEKII
jgi:phytoene desaturase